MGRISVSSEQGCLIVRANERQTFDLKKRPTLPIQEKKHIRLHSPLQYYPHSHQDINPHAVLSDGSACPFFRYATIVIGVVVLLNGIVMTFINIFQCHPVRAAFDLSTPGKCMDIVALYLCSAPVNVITDIAILVLPLPLVTAMRLDLRQKIGLIATFMAGIFVTIVDVVRIYFIQSALIQEIDNGQSVLQSSINGAGIPNFSWYTSYSFMWSAVEANVGLICACALVIKPLLRDYW